MLAVEMPHPQYNASACRGVMAARAGRFTEAQSAYEYALARMDPDVPNFGLLARLASVYWSLGMEAEAKDALEEARLTLEVYSGVTSCSDRTNDPPEVSLLRKDGMPLVSTPARNAAMRMCSDAYRELYSENSLEKVWFLGRVIEEYFRARQLIYGEEHPGS